MQEEMRQTCAADGRRAAGGCCGGCRGAAAFPADDLAAMEAQEPPAAGAAFTLDSLPGSLLADGAGLLVEDRSCGRG